MPQNVVRAVSGIPTAGVLLIFGGVGLSFVFWFSGYTSPVFMVLFVIYVFAIWSFVSAVRRWRGEDPATRPIMKFPFMAIIITVLVLGGIALSIAALFDGLANSWAL